MSVQLLAMCDLVPLGLGPGPKAVFRLLCWRAEDDGQDAFPSNAGIGLSIDLAERSVRAALRKLEKAGWIEQDGYRVVSGKRCKRWVVDVDKLTATSKRVREWMAEGHTYECVGPLLADQSCGCEPADSANRRILPTGGFCQSNRRIPPIEPAESAPNRPERPVTTIEPNRHSDPVGNPTPRASGGGLPGGDALSEGRGDELEASPPADEPGMPDTPQVPPPSAGDRVARRNDARMAGVDVPPPPALSGSLAEQRAAIGAYLATLTGSMGGLAASEWHALKMLCSESEPAEVLEGLVDVVQRGNRAPRVANIRNRMKSRRRDAAIAANGQRDESWAIQQTVVEQEAEAAHLPSWRGTWRHGGKL